MLQRDNWEERAFEVTEWIRSIKPTLRLLTIILFMTMVVWVYFENELINYKNVFKVELILFMIIAPIYAYSESENRNYPFRTTLHLGIYFVLGFLFVVYFLVKFLIDLF
jgi:hypothetical protein